MARLRFRHTALPLAIGFGFKHVSRNLESVGDVHSVLGRRADALTYHFAALLCLLAAFACFIYVGVKIVRYFRGRDDPAPPPPPPSRGREPAVDADAPFDPDAVMARYLAERNASAATARAPSPPQSPAARGFGRKAT